jgi:hypothetical protein
MLGWPGRAFSTCLTFIAVMIAWVLFRADNMLAVQTMFTAMSGVNGFTIIPSIIYAGNLLLHPLLIPGLILIWALPNTQQWIGIIETSESEPATLPTVPHWWRWAWLGTAFALCLVVIILLQLKGAPTEFLYYQF